MVTPLLKNETLTARMGCPKMLRYLYKGKYNSDNISSCKLTIFTDL